MIFLHHRRKGRACRVKLCGTGKKTRGGSSYLHKLHGIKRKTAEDKCRKGSKGDCLGNEPLLPETDISADNRLDIVLINGRIAVTNGIPVRAVLESADDRILADKRDPVIRYDGSKEQGVGLTAF